ncbi:MAG: glycosyltransferase family 2 protein, partial [Acidimicrobiales bacterium]
VEVGLPAQRPALAVRDAVGASIGDRVVEIRPTPVRALPVTVVVATRDRPQLLARCLDSLLRLEYPAVEIVVVDNAPSSDDTADLVRERYASVAYLREDIPGLAIAHNRGLAAAQTPIVAFTDDDVTVDAGWVRALSDAFAVTPDVGCVTGLIVATELETSAQAWIDRHGGFGKGFERRVFHLHRLRPPDPLFPYAAGTFGSGANMAFRTDVLHHLGGFDPALGAGTPSRGGDDLAAFVDGLRAGYSIVYEPAALVHHQHHREDAKVRAQAYNYGVGLSAYATRLALTRPATAGRLALHAPRAIARLVGRRRATGRLNGGYPRQLALLELRGALRGPFAYVHARRLARRLARRHEEAA